LAPATQGSTFNVPASVASPVTVIDLDSSECVTTHQSDPRTKKHWVTFPSVSHIHLLIHRTALCCLRTGLGASQVNKQKTGERERERNVTGINTVTTQQKTNGSVKHFYIIH